MYITGTGTPGIGAGCRVRHSVSQSIPNNTLTTLAFDLEEFDTDTMHDVSVNNSRITFNTSGKYIIGVAIDWDPANASNLRRVRIQDGGVVLAESDSFENATGGESVHQILTTVHSVTAGEFIEVRVLQLSGAALTVLSTWESSPVFWAHQVDATGAKGDTGPTGPPGTGSTVLVQDEGVPLTTAAGTLDFVGAGVTASGVGTTKTITIPGAPADPDKIFRAGHTYAISGEIKVPAGDTDFIVPFYISLAAGQTASIVKARYSINSGTSVTAKLQKNGVDITGYTVLSVTTTPTTTTQTQALAEDDKIALVVTAVSGTPTNLSFTIFIESTQ